MSKGWLRTGIMRIRNGATSPSDTDALNTSSTAYTHSHNHQTYVNCRILNCICCGSGVTPLSIGCREVPIPIPVVPPTPRGMLTVIVVDPDCDGRPPSCAST